MSIERLERLRRLAIVPLRVWPPSRVARKLTQRSSTRTAGGVSESYGKVTFPSEKHHRAYDEESDRPRGGPEQVARGGKLAFEDLLERAEQRVQRVPPQVRLQWLGDLGDRVQRGCHVEPKSRDVRQEP